MIHVYLGITVTIINFLMMGYCLKHLSVINILIPWFISGLIVSLISIVIKKNRNSEKTFSEIFKFEINPLKSKKLLLYFLLSIIAPIIWATSILYIGVGPLAIISHARIFIYMLFAVFVFSEKIHKKEIACGIIVVFGVLLFSYKQEIQFNLGILYAICTATCYAGQKIISKTLANKISYELVIATRATVVIFSLILFTIITNYEFILTTNPTLLLAIFIGGATGSFFTQFHDFKAFESVPLYKYGLLQSLKPVIIFILGGVLLGELIDLQRIAASSLIVGGVLWLELSKLNYIKKLLSFNNNNSG